jgi:peptidoglycan/LPS O-acetylase OafA/YrhL
VPTDPRPPPHSENEDPVEAQQMPPADTASPPSSVARGTSGWRDNVGAALLSLCAVGAILAAASAVGTVADADPATKAVETWRLVGYVFFAGVFVLLALAPRQLRGLWELTIVAKLVLPLAGATFLRGSTDAGTFVVADGIVTVLLVAAYVLVSGWTAPPPHRWPSSTST